MNDKVIKMGQIVVLIDPQGRKHHLLIQGESQKVKGLGVLDTGKLLDKPFGEPVELCGESFIPLRPSLRDGLEAMERKAQIMMPKDSIHLAYECGIGPGSLVVESGAGSGGSTMILAHLVGKTGQVIVYELREDFIKVAERNLEKTGLRDQVELRLGDVTAALDVQNADAVVLDIPNPWDAVENAWNALRPGGSLATYTPTVNQLERAHGAMKEQGFRDLRAHENIRREMDVKPGATRPKFEMLGHTGYLLFGVKMGT